MLSAAMLIPIPAYAFDLIRQAFLAKMQLIQGLSLVNDLDYTSPPLSFQFSDKSLLCDSVRQLGLDIGHGCKSCRPNMGRNIGCEYTQRCECLDYAAVDVQRLATRDLARYLDHQGRDMAGNAGDTTGLPKRFPYEVTQPPRLQRFYLHSRHPIYECNSMCKCGPGCKNRLVQHGRQLPLVIFKTADRGWGVRSSQNIVRGQFVDTYRGEVITNVEADRREQAISRTGDKHSYLFQLDKFVGEPFGPTAESCYVLDSNAYGGPTRFINHSCHPNLRQFTVSYNKHDLFVYELALFALRDIPAGEELTFDYMDADEPEEEDAVQRRMQALCDPANADRPRCRCGTTKCRGFLWMK